MASFYLSDENWKQGAEITLESFGQEKVMKNCLLNSEISDFANKLYLRLRFFRTMDVFCMK